MCVCVSWHEFYTPLTFRLPFISHACCRAPGDENLPSNLISFMNGQWGSPTDPNNVWTSPWGIAIIKAFNLWSSSTGHQLKRARSKEELRFLYQPATCSESTTLAIHFSVTTQWDLQADLKLATTIFNDARRNNGLTHETRKSMGTKNSSQPDAHSNSLPRNSSSRIRRRSHEHALHKRPSVLTLFSSTNSQKWETHSCE